MNYYSLMRNFWDYAFENPEKIKPNHCAIFCFAVDQCNRLGWKSKFGFPAQNAMDAVGIVSFKTYSKVLSELVEMGFIEMVQKTQNQHTANIIALVNFTEAIDRALDRAILKQVESDNQSNVQSNSTINRPIYQLTNLPINKSTSKNEKFISELRISDQWLEVISMQNKISKVIALEYLERFDLVLQSAQDIKNSKSDYCGHFSRWLPIELKKVASVTECKKEKVIGFS